jgi:hypothetical protein
VGSHAAVKFEIFNVDVDVVRVFLRDSSKKPSRCLIIQEIFTASATVELFLVKSCSSSSLPSHDFTFPRCEAAK